MRFIFHLRKNENNPAELLESTVVDRGIREILFYRCLGFKGIGQFAGHIVPPVQSFTSKSWKRKTRFWDLKRTSLHFENVFLATRGGGVRARSTCVRAQS